MDDLNFGGVDKSAVTEFEAQILLGNRFEKVKKAENSDDIILACLRVAWMDAFRHVTKNNDENIKKYFNTPEKLDAQIYEILKSELVLGTFKNFANATSSDYKADIICKAMDKGLREKFQTVKMIDDEDRPLRFGHFQKLFNMAQKIYLCLYMLRDERWISEDKMVKFAFECADCPIDNRILAKIDKNCAPGHKSELLSEYKYKKFDGIHWSKLDASEKDLYVFIQTVIGEIEEGKSKLYFDFKNWNPSEKQ